MSAVEKGSEMTVRYGKTLWSWHVETSATGKRHDVEQGDTDTLLLCERKNMNCDVLQSGGPNISRYQACILASSASSVFSVSVVNFFASETSPRHTRIIDIYNQRRQIF